MANARKRLAVLFDAENIPHKHLLKIISAIDTYGDAIIKRAYADWMLPQLSAWRNPLHKYDIQAIQTLRIVAIQAIQTLRIVAGKNLADIAMTVDAMDIMHEGIVDGVCIISSDSDFTPLVRRLQDSGLFVLGIGLSQTPAPFRLACNKFLKIEDLTKSQKPKENKPKTQQKKENKPKTQQKNPIQTNKVKSKSVSLKPRLDKIKDARAKQLAIRLIHALSISDTKWVALSSLGTTLKEENASFDTKSYGFSSLGKAAQSFPKLFQIRKQGTNDASIKLIVNDLSELLVQAMAIADSPLITLSNLGKNLRAIDASFDIKSYGFSSLGKAIQSFPELFQIEMKQGKINRIKLVD